MIGSAETMAAHVWAMEPGHLQVLFARLQAWDRQEIALDVGDTPKPSAPELKVDGATARIAIRGAILKAIPWYFSFLGIDATSTDDVRRQIAEALGNDSVEGIHLEIDSPGGTVEGIQAVADDIRAARGSKRVTAHADDLIASAAYWIGSQADKLTAGLTAAVGSIGVYTVAIDSSEAAAADGVKVHVLSSSPLKGAGVPGSEITEAQLDDTQRLIDGYAALFVAAVEEGRGMDHEKAEALATGQIWIGRDAKKRGLVDGIARGDLTGGTTAQPAAAISQSFEPRSGAPTEDTMSEKALAEAQAEIAKLTARAEAAESTNSDLEAKLEQEKAAAAIAEENQKASIIDRYRDRFAPSALDHVKGYAAKATAAELEAFLKAMPQLTHPDPDGATGEGNEPTTDEPRALAEDEIDICKRLGITHADFRKYGEAKTATWDGKGLDADGEVIQ